MNKLQDDHLEQANRLEQQMQALLTRDEQRDREAPHSSLRLLQPVPVCPSLSVTQPLLASLLLSPLTLTCLHPHPLTSSTRYLPFLPHLRMLNRVNADDRA